MNYRGRIEIVFLFLFAMAGVWQVRTWLNAGVERFRKYMYRRLATPPKHGIALPLRHQCFSMPLGDTGDFTHTDEIVDANGHVIAEMHDGCDESCLHFKTIVDTMNQTKQ